MKQNLLTLVISLFLCIDLQAQHFEWAKQMGGFQATVIGHSITVARSGNIYTTGYFDATADFDPGTAVFNMSPSGTHNTFIQKLDSTGNFVWAKKISSAIYDNDGSFIAVDSLENVYIAGHFFGQTDFDPGSGVFSMTSSLLGGDGYFLKLNSSGNLLWAKDILVGAGGPLVDHSGNIFFTGSFSNTTDFDPGPGVHNLTSYGGKDIFVEKLDNLGNLVWVIQQGGTGDDTGYSLTMDPSGNIYMTGKSGNPFIQKLNPSGNVIWLKNSPGYLIEYGKSGNIYVAGSFSGTVDFDPGAGTSYLTSNTVYYFYLSKFDTSGNFKWVKQMIRTISDLAIDDSENLYTTGYFYYNNHDFDPGPSICLLGVSNGSTNFNILKLDSAGNFKWAKIMGGNGSEYPHSLAIDLHGNLYTIGSFENGVDFDPGPPNYLLIAAGHEDAFIQKMSYCAPSYSPTLTATACSQYTINNQTLTASGTYLQFLSNSSGCDSVVTLDLTIGQITVSAVANPDTVFCKGSSILLTVLPAGMIYQWIKNSLNISGATSQQLTVNKKGDYACNVTSQCGTVTSNIIQATQLATPNATITPSGTVILCSGSTQTLQAPAGSGRTYQWKKGTNILAGATNSSLVVSAAGKYKVVVTKTSTGCSKTSAATTIEVQTCREVTNENVSGNTLTVYPNPTLGELMVSFNSASSGEGILQVKNILGQTVQSASLAIQTGANEFQLNLDGLQAGIYWVEVKTNGGTVVRKLLKQ